MELAGFDIDAVDGTDGALIRMEEMSVDIFLVSPQVFRSEGIPLCRELRGASVPPFVVLTEAADDLDCVLALGLGAADYIATSSSPRVVIARLQAIIRRLEGGSITPSKSPVRRAGKFTLDLKSRSILYSGSPVDVTGGEYDLFWTLFKNFNRVVKRETLLVALRQQVTEAASQTLDTRIYRLRRRCELAGAPGQVIKCIRNRGYVLLDR